MTEPVSPDKHPSGSSLKPVARLSAAQAPWLDLPDVQQIFKVIDEAGFAARAVGGCVRDSLLGRARHSDVDFATTMPADTVMDVFTARGIKIVPTGLAHGTVTVIGESLPETEPRECAFPAQYEITTLRRDVATDGRHARIAYTDDWVADAQRRDFSMNALYADAEGGVYDPLAAVGQSGLAALQARRLEFIGDAEERIVEDYLRILRFFRFHFGFFADAEPNAAALQAIRRHGAGLEQLSGERVKQELCQILSLPHTTKVLSLMTECRVWEAVFGAPPDPDARAALAAIEATIEAAIEVAIEVAIEEVVEEALPAISDLALLRLAVLTTGRVEHMAERLRLSNKEKARVKNVDDPVLQNQLMQAWGDDDLAACDRLLYYHGVEALGDHLWRAMMTPAGRDHARYALWGHHIRQWQKPTCPIQAADIMDLGVSAGPALGQLLDACEAHWVASHFQLNRDDLLQHAASAIEDD